MQKTRLDSDRSGQASLHPLDHRPKKRFPLILILIVGLLAINFISQQLGMREIIVFPGGNQPWHLSLVLLGFTQMVMWLSPSPRPWSRFAIVTTLLGLTFRYIFWRGWFTLSWADPLSTGFSLSFLVMELLIIFNTTVQLILFLGESDRRPEADINSLAVLEGSYQPSIDILIPTYNEPDFVLRRTIIGCQAMDYPRKQVYLLDDTNRPQIRQLAKDLGCEYITRLDNSHAKAGNLNHGIRQNHGELITVFDADFVPTKNFLTRTVGFFQDQTIGLVQTHQSFFNVDPATKNLGLENALTHEVEVFSRYYQPLRDGTETALCYGSSFVVRRSALEAIGGFVTGTVSEDYLTGINLSSLGYRVLYLDESLSAGVVPDNMAGHIAQRQRWARGTTQAFFVKSNPLTIPGLTPRQRLAHLEGILQWFTSICQVAFLLAPLGYFFLGILPLQTTLPDWIYYFVPYYLVQLSTFSWLNRHSRSALISMVYSVISCFPIAITVVHTLFSPFSRGFKVTPKGTTSDRSHYNWLLASPVIVVFCLTLVSLGINLSRLWEANPVTPLTPQTSAAIQLGLFWGFLNLLVEALVIISFWDVPKFDRYDRLPKSWVVEIDTGTQVWSAMTTHLWEAGAEITLFIPTHQEFPANLETIKLFFPQQQLAMTGWIKKIERLPQPKTHSKAALKSSLLTKTLQIQIAFDVDNLPQQRKLVESLFCQPGQWRSQCSPGELTMLGLMFKAVIYPFKRLMFF